MKVISLVPSITEALLDLGLTENEVIGRTKFCIHPYDRIKNIEIIGGTKNCNIEKIKQLNPDIIIANKEENTREQVEELQKTHKVIVTNISTIEDNYYLLKNLGIYFRCEEKAQLYNLKIYDIFQQIKNDKKLKVAYLIWQNPFMTIGKDTFIHTILSELGFDNIFKNTIRYPQINIEDLAEADVIFLSSEPFPFQQKHIDELQKIYPQKKIMLVNGEAFSWYGTHLAKCENYFRKLILDVNFS